MCNDEQYVSTSLGMTLQMCFHMHFMTYLRHHYDRELLDFTVHALIVCRHQGRYMMID